MGPSATGKTLIFPLLKPPSAPLPPSRTPYPNWILYYRASQVWTSHFLASLSCSFIHARQCNVGKIKELLHAHFGVQRMGKDFFSSQVTLKERKMEWNTGEIGREQVSPRRDIIGPPEWRHSVTCSLLSCLCVFLFSKKGNFTAECFWCSFLEEKPLLLHDISHIQSCSYRQRFVLYAWTCWMEKAQFN